MARIYLGNVKGPKGDTGATGATGPQGNAATIEVGAVSTTAYGNQAQVTNVGSSSAAKFDFVIPQGKPGEKTTTMSGLTLDTVTTSADEFPVPAVSENGSTVWGKVIKFFQDTVAALTGKLDANKIVNSQAVTESGYGLDALQANPNVSGSLAAQISDLNNSLTVSTSTTVIDMNVALSGDTAWHNTEQTIDYSAYKYLVVTCGCHGAIYNSIIVPKAILAITPTNFLRVSAFYDTSNQGCVEIYNTGRFYAFAKTQNYKFDVIVKGLK